MKDQYFGDINDYAKYGILRTLGGIGRCAATVCWMKTSNGSSGDGRHVQYLSRPASWRRFDPHLFDSLKRSVIDRGERSVRDMERSSLLRRTVFFSKNLATTDRGTFFAGCMRAASESDLVFFDPDIGLETEHSPRRRRRAAQYLLWSEANRFWQCGFSLLIYQHFPRVQRLPYVHRRIADIRWHLGTRHIAALATSRVVFFLVVQPRHRRRIDRALHVIERRWAPFISLSSYPDRRS